MSKKEAKTQLVHHGVQNKKNIQQLKDFRYRKISQIKTTLFNRYAPCSEHQIGRLDDAYLRPLAPKQRLVVLVLSKIYYPFIHFSGGLEVFSYNSFENLFQIKV